MAKYRFKKDYELEESFSASGRVKKSSVYIGDPCFFVEGADAAAAQAKRCLVLCVAAWVCFIGSMCFVSDAMRRLYVALPFVFSGVPLALVTTHVLALKDMREPLERRHMDRLNNRFPAAAMFLVMFALFALAGEGVGLVIAAVRDGRALSALFSPGEIAFIVGCCGLLFCGLRLFAARRALRCEARSEQAQQA